MHGLTQLPFWHALSYRQSLFDLHSAGMKKQRNSIRPRRGRCKGRRKCGDGRPTFVTVDLRISGPSVRTVAHRSVLDGGALGEYAARIRDGTRFLAFLVDAGSGAGAVRVDGTFGQGGWYCGGGETEKKKKKVKTCLAWRSETNDLRFRIIGCHLCNNW